MTAPIALFVYNRPEQTHAALTGLRRCHGFDPARLHIFADGPKRGVSGALVQETRAVVAELAPNAKVYAAPENKGLAASITSAVSQLVDQHGSVIALEDDLLPSPDFIHWMDASLARYRDADRVMQISGFSFNVDVGTQPVFLSFASTWGWATWDRAWKHFDQSMKGVEQLRNSATRRRFNVLGSYPYDKMVHQQVAGDIDSWGIAWNWSLFKSDGLVLYPPRSRILNLGVGTGTHKSWRQTSKIYEGRAVFDDLPSFEYPEPALNEAALRKIARALRLSRLGL